MISVYFCSSYSLPNKILFLIESFLIHGAPHNILEPLIETEPLVLFINPESASNNEVLPEPTPPAIIINSPFLILKLTSFNESKFLFKDVSVVSVEISDEILVSIFSISFSSFLSIILSFSLSCSLLKISHSKSQLLTLTAYWESFKLSILKKLSLTSLHDINSATLLRPTLPLAIAEID